MIAQPLPRSNAAKQVSSGDVIAALSKKYPAPAFAFLEQVTPGTGWAANRFCDAMAMSLWPSRGLDLIGFEVKVSRHDWIRELKKPEKAEELASSCHRWFIVATPGVVDLAELPAKWGLLEYRSGKLFTVRDAPRQDAPAPTWKFVAAILRRSSETMVPKSAVDKLVEEQLEALVEKRAKEKLRHEDYQQRDLRRLGEAVDAFERESGIKITTWEGGDLGRYVEIGRCVDRNRLRRLQEELSRSAKNIDDALAAVEKKGPE